jgi:hypothetical protein
VNVGNPLVRLAATGLLDALSENGTLHLARLNSQARVEAILDRSAWIIKTRLCDRVVLWREYKVDKVAWLCDLGVGGTDEHMYVL